MDILDNIIYATYHSPLNGGNFITSDYMNLPATPPALTNPGPPAPPVTIYSYDLVNKLNYCALRDVKVIERGIAKHWYDVNDRLKYSNFSSFEFSSTYHLMYAYLIENTRIFQIFERFIEKYITDEELGIANDELVFNWIANSERLFFRSDSPKATNLRSVIRPSSDASRRNAYYRMFGMDLAFGDIDSKNTAIPYFKAKASNQQFVPLFERFLSEVWQGYINARNSSGVNTSDVNVLEELANQLKEMLAARRGSITNYAAQNLSREEYSSVLNSNWFTFIISYDSPIVTHLSCQSSTIGERLMKIGDKVGIKAHRKCQALFEMADAAARILLSIETGDLLNNASWLQDMLASLDPNNNPPTLHSEYMTLLLTVINNWEKATGHPIKNPQSNISGTVSIKPNGSIKQPSLN